MSSPDALSESLSSVTFGKSSNTQLHPARLVIATAAGMPEDDVYVVSSGSRASNLPIRLVQGKARDRHYPLAIGILGPDVSDANAIELAMKHAVNLSGPSGAHDAIGVIALRNGSQWDLVGLAAEPGSDVAKRLQQRFPHTQVVGISQSGSVGRTAATAPLGGDTPIIPPAGSDAPSPVFVSAPLDELTVQMVRHEAAARRLDLPANLVIECVTALRAGKHLLLTGPPGTGKTSVAQLLADVATSVQITRGSITTTATSDWTSVDTIGAYRLTHENTLRFHPGLAVEAIAKDRWLVIDELNRSDIDKSIGQLFTILSGKPVVLPFEVEEGKRLRRLALTPEGAPPFAECINLEVPSSWRVIATMNDTDLDLLYEVSQALKRRFAVVRVDALPGLALSSLLSGQALTNHREVDSMLASAATDVRLSLGAALWLDLAAYCQEAVAVAGEEMIDVDAAAIVAAGMRIVFEPQGIEPETVIDVIESAFAQLVAP